MIPRPGIEVTIGNGIVTLHINIVRIAEAVSVIIGRILRRLPVFTTCTVLREELLNMVGQYS